MNRQLINGDCLEELKKLDDNSVDLLCTDPPYGYGFMGKHWDTFKEKDSTKSQQVGWMSPGMKKDTYGMKEFFDPIWKECLRVLKPGALAFVMSAPRSDVQTIMSQTLRDAGFDISFTPIYWTYASGFPKAMNIGKMIDKIFPAFVKNSFFFPRIFIFLIGSDNFNSSSSNDFFSKLGYSKLSIEPLVFFI